MKTLNEIIHTCWWYFDSLNAAVHAVASFRLYVHVICTEAGHKKYTKAARMAALKSLPYEAFLPDRNKWVFCDCSLFWFGWKMRVYVWKKQVTELISQNSCTGLVLVGQSGSLFYVHYNLESQKFEVGRLCKNQRSQSDRYFTSSASLIFVRIHLI